MDASSDTFSPDELKVFETYIKDTLYNKGLTTYYLKIPDANGIELSKICVISNNGATANTVILLDTKYNFKEKEGFKNAINEIKSLSKSDINYDDTIRWYFICVGHGFGYNIFDSNKNLSLDSIAAQRYKNIIHVSDLTDAFDDMLFTLGIFNNCDFTLLDNCFILSTKFRYLIAPQNYTALRLFDIKNFLMELNESISENIASFKFSEKVFLQTRERICQVTTTQPTSKLVGSTIFFFWLEHFILLINKLNDLSLLLFEKVSSDESTEWYRKIRTALSSSTFDYVDLVNFLTELETLLNPEINIFVSQIKNEINRFENPRKGVEMTNLLHGISIYLPEYGKNFSKLYNNYKSDCIKWHSRIKWYVFMESIVNKTKDPSIVRKILNFIGFR
ncbi:hypothetical protein BH11BAC4_BH11BAC4_16780 [soil metagenome]